MLDEARVNRISYLEDVPRALTRWIDTGWAIAAQHAFKVPDGGNGSEAMVVADKSDAQTCVSQVLSVFLDLLLWIVWVLSLLLAALHFVSYTRAKALVDKFVTMGWVPAILRIDFTEPHYHLVSGRLLIVASVFGICGLTLALFKTRLLIFLLEVRSECTRVRISIRDQLFEGKETGVEIGAVFIVFVIGMFLRVWHLSRAIRYDEAWSYVVFASRPLVISLSNYLAPNNHLLNTLLVHFSTRLFGNTVLGLRFPALAAGCLVIVASWFVTRKIYGRVAGILVAACIATFPTFIEFSINARGYTLQWLFFLAMIWFAIELRENPSLKISWLGFALAAVAGIYAIPTMLLIIAGIVLWLWLSVMTDGDANKLKTVTRQLATAALAIGIFSILLYVPALLFGARGALMARDVVVWQQDVFAQGFKDMCGCAWIEWTAGVPTTILWVLFGGLATGLLLHRRLCQYPVPMLIALCFPAAIFIWVRHVFAFPRVWSYLLLGALMTASGGLSLFLVLFVGRSRFRQTLVAGTVAIGLAMIVGARIIQQRVLFTSNETGYFPDADQIVEFLAGNVRPGDSVVSNAIIDYELLQHHPKLYNSLANPPEAAHVLGVVAKNIGGETCEAQNRMALYVAQDVADPQYLKLHLDLNNYTNPQVLAKFVTSTVYSLNRKSSGIEPPN